MLNPVVSGYNSVVYTKKITDLPLEAFYNGKSNLWFGQEVIPLIEKYDPYANGGNPNKVQV